MSGQWQSVWTLDVINFSAYIYIKRFAHPSCWARPGGLIDVGWQAGSDQEVGQYLHSGGPSMVKGH
eukprot:4581228-Karenia_brevis.AAC.1